MNRYAAEARSRKRCLLIVEGHHEKNELFRLVFECFPELDIDIGSVWIYGTNIYMLYEDIVKEYGCSWAEEGIDIDLPFVISKRRTRIRFVIKMILLILLSYLIMKGTIRTSLKIRFQKCKPSF